MYLQFSAEASGIFGSSACASRTFPANPRMPQHENISIHKHISARTFLDFGFVFILLNISARLGGDVNITSQNVCKFSVIYKYGYPLASMTNETRWRSIFFFFFYIYLVVVGKQKSVLFDCLHVN